MKYRLRSGGLALKYGVLILAGVVTFAVSLFKWIRGIPRPPVGFDVVFKEDFSTDENQPGQPSDQKEKA